MMNENNKVLLVGQVIGKFEYSHKMYGESFYEGKLKIERISGVADFIVFMVSDRMVDVTSDWDGIFVEIEGEYRSFNRHENEKSKLELFVFVKDIKQSEADYNDNQIKICGYTTKEINYRTTPYGREVADILLAVHRPYRKSDYIPCIAWGRNARYASSIPVGTRIKLEGRIQSREYIKHISDTETETRTAYEVSISKLEVVEDKE